MTHEGDFPDVPRTILYVGVTAILTAYRAVLWVDDRVPFGPELPRLPDELR